MHIVLYHFATIPPSDYGGTERVIYWLTQGLLSLGHRVTLLAKEGSQVPGAEVISLNEINHSRWTQLIPREADLVHLHATPREPQRITKPFLVTIHGNGQPNEAFHPNSVFLSKTHAKNHGSEFFVYNGINPDEYRSEEKREEYLVFLAKASWSVKNLRGAIDVARGSHRPLIVLGSRNWPGNLQRTFSRVFGRGIYYYGMAKDPEKKTFLSKASGLLFPVRWHEPFGLAVTEALASGCPVFATPYGSLPELINPDCGVLSPDAKELAASLIRRDSFSPAICQKRIQNGLTHLQMAEKYLSLYSQVIERGYLSTSNPRTEESSLIQRTLLPWNSI